MEPPFAGTHWSCDHQERGSAMAAHASAGHARLARARTGETPPLVPAQDGDPIAALRAEARACRMCPLWKPATQTVFGEGPPRAEVMFVGEQPGDREDRAGRPFVGPAGQLFDKALKEAGLDRAKSYITNAVKHFKFTPRGKIRLHQKPNAMEIRACRPWLAREIETVRPKIVVALGATAGQSLLGRAVPIGRNRGAFLPLGEARALVTVHPSFLLRVHGEGRRAEEYARFVRELRLVRTALEEA